MPESACVVASPRQFIEQPEQLGIISEVPGNSVLSQGVVIVPGAMQPRANDERNSGSACSHKVCSGFIGKEISIQSLVHPVGNRTTLIKRAARLWPKPNSNCRDQQKQERVADNPFPLESGRRKECFQADGEFGRCCGLRSALRLLTAGGAQFPEREPLKCVFAWTRSRSLADAGPSRPG